jgi:CHAD domain-containing protein
MATHTETERKFELGDAPAVPDLVGVDDIEQVSEPESSELDATYFDTHDLRLARSGTALRRRTGGSDEGWHLKLAPMGDTRIEQQVPLYGDSTDVPKELRDMVRGRLGHQDLRPVATIHTTRVERRLLDGTGEPLAVVADDHVRAHRSGNGAVALLEWREIEVELEEGSIDLLDAVTERLIDAGLRASEDRSKLHRVLGFDVAPPVPETGSKAEATILGHLAEQVEAIVAGDARVRADEDEAVHDMRVGSRRLRSALTSFRPFLDQRRTEPLRDELKWLGQELGRLRDTEVLSERLLALVGEEPSELVLGPVAERIELELRHQQQDDREAVLVALDSDRYLDLLDDLHELVDDPPWSDRRPTKRRMRGRVAHAFHRMDARADAVPDEEGEARNAALHELRKAAKRARYAAEATVPRFGKDASRAASRAEDLQDVLGEHQDSIRSQEVLRRLGVTAHLSGENGFSFGLLLGVERRRAAAADAAHVEPLRRTTTRKARGWLDG